MDNGLFIYIYISFTSHKLQRNQRGRLQRTAPLRRAAQPRILRPSRPSLRTDLVGHDVQCWFRQLRRLQSYLQLTHTGWNSGIASLPLLDLVVAFPAGGQPIVLKMQQPSHGFLELHLDLKLLLAFFSPFGKDFSALNLGAFANEPTS